MSPEDPLRRFRLDDKVALVTGASSGLGRRFAGALAGAGASVVLAARRADRLEELAGELARAHPVATDVTIDSDLERLVGEALSAFGRIDVLVNAAGAIAPATAEEESLESFRATVAVNLTAAFALSKLVAPHMFASPEGGAIVNVASILGLRGSGQIPQASYAASKGGIVNLTRELAAQWARRNVRVNAVAPGFFASEMTDEMLSSEAGRRFIARRTPMGRPGEAHELDGALLFLASPASSYVTGQVLVVDGGWTAV